MESMERIRVILDTDVGVDDVMALEMFLNCKKINLELITIVFGNVSPEVSVKALSLLVDDMSIVRVGAKDAIVDHDFSLPSWPGHGLDGLGDSYEAVKKMKGKGDQLVKMSQQHASLAMIEKITECWEMNDPCTVVCIGPLTNLALACKLDEGLLRKVKKVFIMGGCLFGKGNTGLASEYNFHCDPVSVKIVFGALESKITLVPWECTLDCALDWKWMDEGKEKNNLFYLVNKKYEEIGRSTGKPFVLCDVCCAAIVIDERLIDVKHNFKYHIETNEGPLKGSNVWDWNTKEGICVVEKIDVKAYERLCRESFFRN